MNADRSDVLPWAEPGWRAEAETWIAGRLARLGLGLLGPVEEHQVRPWSAVLRTPTPAGTVYFKASTPVLGHEPALTQALWRWRPDCIVPVLAADAGRGWLLLGDAGAGLRGMLTSAADLYHWERVLREYAALQIDLAGRLPELLALGVLDRRPAALPGQVEALLAHREALLIGLPDGLSEEEYARLRAGLPRLKADCEALAAMGLPETLHHDDFHDGNVFVQDGRYVLADWGESCAAHPFFSLLIPPRSVAWRLGLAENDPAIVRLRDAYLEPWTAYGSRRELLAAAALARRLAMAARALTWHQVLVPLPAALRHDHQDAVPGWLQVFLGAG